MTTPDFLKIATQSELALFLKTTYKKIRFLCYGKNQPYYINFNLSKKSGEARRIDSPNKNLKQIQEILAEKLGEIYLDNYENKNVSHGFIKKRSVVTNADIHLNSHVIINIDLENFFPSINFGRVRGLFAKPPFSFNSSISTILAQICCYKGKLPQGAPTSPIISNFICRNLDRELYKFSKKYMFRYSRYADDITFSLLEKSKDNLTQLAILGEDKISITISDHAIKIINKNGFKLNNIKNRITFYTAKQLVTGIKVNKIKNVSRTYIRQIRALMHDWEKNGFANAQAKFKKTYKNSKPNKLKRKKSPNLLQYLEGKLSYLKMVKGETDLVFCRYYLFFCRLTQKTYYLNSTALNDNGLLNESVWLILGIDKSTMELFYNGTAFYLEKIGFITSKHTIDEIKEVSGLDIVLARPKNFLEKKEYFDCSILKESSDIDISILSSSAIPSIALRPPKDTNFLEGINVVIPGFPYWVDPPQQYQRARVAYGKLNHIRYIKKNLCVDFSCDVFSGNSGGPILDKDAAVIGVVRYGIDGSITKNSGVHISQILELASSST